MLLNLGQLNKTTEQGVRWTKIIWTKSELRDWTNNQIWDWTNIYWTTGQNHQNNWTNNRKSIVHFVSNASDNPWLLLCLIQATTHPIHRLRVTIGWQFSMPLAAIRQEWVFSSKFGWKIAKIDYKMTVLSSKLGWKIAKIGCKNT